MATVAIKLQIALLPPLSFTVLVDITTPCNQLVWSLTHSQRLFGIMKSYEYKFSSAPRLQDVPP
jgi:hypothetical protein